MKRLLALAMVLAVCSVSGAAAQPAPTAEVLTLERAIELALQQQPVLRQVRATVEAANARVDQARVIRRPTASFNANANIGSSRAQLCAVDSTQQCGGFFDPTRSTGFSLQVGWRIFDFGRTSANIRAAELSAQAAATAIDTVDLDVRTNVEVAYLEAVARRQLVEVARATVESEDGHLDQAKKFVAAQAKDPIEVAQAQARAANARSALAQARAAEAIALANLRAAIGWLDATRAPVVQSSWPTPPASEPVALAGLVEAARAHRPELMQLERQIEAAEATATAASYGNRPILAATSQMQWNPNDNNWTPEPSWNAALTLSWQFFDGGRARAETRLARANVTSAKAERDALLVQLTSQLASQREQIVANRANVLASEEAVAAARAQLELAEARYRHGLGSQIELADAQTAVTTAEGNLVLAQWQLADAWAQLRRALGGER
jgi:outer membrane protein